MIHVFKNQQQEGPYSEKQIKDKLMSGELQLSDLAWREGISAWIPISALLGISLPPALSASQLRATTKAKSNIPPFIRTLFIAGGSVFAFIVVLLIFSSSEVNDTTRNATRSAWNSMQQADFECQAISPPSARYAKLSLLYSEIDYTNVDKKLIQHIHDSVAVYNDWLAISRLIEAEVKKQNADAVAITQLGGLLGALAGDGENPEGDLVAGGLVGMGVAAANRDIEFKAVIDKYRPQLDRLSERSDQLDAVDDLLAKELSAKYSTEFIDAL